jgi:V/A-type H+-transporting ATPase subunit K
VDDFILALGWVGVYAPLALGAVGSMVGVGRGGMAACGALLEVESGYGRFIGVSAMPSSQTIYGIVVMLTLNVGVTKSKPEVFGISIAPAAVVEGFAVFAFVFALVLVGSVPGMGG